MSSWKASFAASAHSTFLSGCNFRWRFLKTCRRTSGGSSLVCSKVSRMAARRAAAESAGVAERSRPQRLNQAGQVHKRRPVVGGAGFGAGEASGAAAAVASPEAALRWQWPGALQWRRGAWGPLLGFVSQVLVAAQLSAVPGLGFVSQAL